MRHRGILIIQSSCGACHGIDAKGHGPVGKELKTRPTDLTVLAKNNNSVFPFNTVYEMIDGRNSTISSHGARENTNLGISIHTTTRI